MSATSESSGSLKERIQKQNVSNAPAFSDADDVFFKVIL